MKCPKGHTIKVTKPRLAHNEYLAQVLCTKCDKYYDLNHDCMDHAVIIFTDGPIGHGWECGKCGRFLQAG